MTEPKVSIIIPVYKVRPTDLDECCKSLFNQTSSDVEFIFVFDGQQNEALHICKKYQQQDSRFKTFINSHLGVSVARNFGISQAKGQYVLFVDADDYIPDPKALTKIYSYCTQTNCEILLYGWLETEKNVIHHYLQENIPAFTSTQKDNTLKELLFCKNFSFSGAPWAKAFRRDFLLQNAISFKPSCPIGQDRVFNYEAVQKATRISYLKEAYYAYRTYDASATQKFRPNGLLDLLPYIEELKKLSSNKYPALIGRETLEMFYRSWATCYMNKKNTTSLFTRMKELLSIIKTARFHSLIEKIDISNLPFLPKIESQLLQKHIYFWLYLHGIKHLF